MKSPTSETCAELLCDRCGYDLRAHPEDGKCPECGMSVEESKRLAGIPRRPAWRDSDPRWRRRMLAGVWILVLLLPLLDVLRMFDWFSNVQAPNVFHFPGGFPLSDSMLGWIYRDVIFCMGIVLLFSKERGRRVSRFDWTRRWGVLCSYVVLLINAASTLFVSALVLAGICDVFHSMPLKYQPHITQWFVKVSTSYLHYGPQPKNFASVVVVVFSCAVVELACFSLYDALRSCGAKRMVAILLLAPLVLFALIHIPQAGHDWLDGSWAAWADISLLTVYFRPTLLVNYIVTNSTSWFSQPSLRQSGIEATKWGIMLTIAIWLSVAQIAAWSQSKKAKE